MNRSLSRAAGTAVFRTAMMLFVVPVSQEAEADPVQTEAPLAILLPEAVPAQLIPEETPTPSMSVLPPSAIEGSLWVAQGPAPIINGQVENIPPNNEVVGAIHTVAIDPSDPNTIYIGAVNGGIWKTTNATAPNPTWMPLTDFLPSLSIGALEFDPTDISNMALVAGIGRFSSMALDGGARTGLLRTTDGGTTWTQLDGAGTLANKNISGVAPRGGTIVVSVNFAVPFVFANIGIFRSTDGGATFTQISGAAGTGLPPGRGFDLVGHPSTPTELYASVRDAGASNGIYKSTDMGATWSLVSNAAMNALILDVAPYTSNIEMASTMAPFS